MVLKEAKTEEFSDLGLMYKFYKVLQNWYLFKCAMTEASKNSKTTQHQATKRGEPCTTTGQYLRQDKFRHLGQNCNKGDIMSTSIWDLTVEYQPAIANTKLQGE